MDRPAARRSSTSEVVTISASSAPRDSARRSRISLGILGEPSIAGVVGVLALITTVTGVVIAYLDWQNNLANNPPPVSTSASASPGASPSASPALSPSASPTPLRDLGYQLAAKATGSRVVEVSATASGQPEEGLTYWFVLEINWGGGNVDYYPRRKMTANSAIFDLTLPADSNTTFARKGRVYALDARQSREAQIRLDRQSGSKEDDFFAEATGKTVSNVVALPFG
jgi:hypothetical protein